MANAKRRWDSEDSSSKGDWDEPVFGDADDDLNDDEPHFDEPVFGATFNNDFDNDFEAGEDDEPIFDPADPGYRPDPRVAESLAVGASAAGASMLSRQSRRANASEEQPSSALLIEQPTHGRRLGRTGPFWLMGAGALIVVLLIVLLFLLRNGDEEIAAVETVTPVAAGELGNVTFPSTQSISVTAVLEPTATPLPVLNAGQRVVVANTDGQGIRLRDRPSTGALTLEIFQDGATFTVLNSDGDYATYPVEADGYRWYRIQVADNPEENLTGWTVADFLQAAE